jgi:hypothetical protein
MVNYVRTENKRTPTERASRIARSDRLLIANNNNFDSSKIKVQYGQGGFPPSRILTGLHVEGG